MSHFYCQRLTGDVEFSIEEWNKAFKELSAAGLDMPSDPPACKDQCFECVAIVGDQRLKSKKYKPVKNHE